MKKTSFIAVSILVLFGLWATAATAGNKIDLGNPALLVIDVANDVCHQKGVLNKLGVWKYAKEHDTFENIDRAIYLAEKKGIPIIRIWIDYHPGMPDVPNRGFIYHAKEKFGEFFIEGTWGAKPIAGLEPKEGQLEVIKKRFNSFHNTNLKPLLDALGVDTLIVTGVSCHACVNGTIVGGNDWDYRLIALHDGIAGPSDAMCDFLFKSLWPSWGVQVVTVSEALGK